MNRTTKLTEVAIQHKKIILSSIKITRKRLESNRNRITSFFTCNELSDLIFIETNHTVRNRLDDYVNSYHLPFVKEVVSNTQVFDTDFTYKSLDIVNNRFLSYMQSNFVRDLVIAAANKLHTGTKVHYLYDVEYYKLKSLWLDYLESEVNKLPITS